MKPNRREFTLMGAGSAVATLSTPSVLSALSIDPATSSSTGATETPWYRRIKRIGQTNFNEKIRSTGTLKSGPTIGLRPKSGPLPSPSLARSHSTQPRCPSSIAALISTIATCLESA